MCQLVNTLDALATLPDLETLLAEIPDYAAYRVDQYLDQACTTLVRFATLWKTHRDADACHLQEQQEQLLLLPEGSAEPPQSRQPAQAPRRGETGSAPPRAETEDATQQPAQTDADYDTTRFYLGKRGSMGIPTATQARCFGASARVIASSAIGSRNTPSVRHHAKPWKAGKNEQNPLPGGVCLLTKGVLIRVRPVRVCWRLRSQAH